MGVHLVTNASFPDWKKYLRKESDRSFFITVFTPCEKFVLDTRPTPRNHPLLVEAVEHFGDAASGAGAQLAVVEIPDDVVCAICLAALKAVGVGV